VSVDKTFVTSIYQHYAVAALPSALSSVLQALFLHEENISTPMVTKQAGWGGGRMKSEERKEREREVGKRK
jgi:hypothetical protein